MDRDKAALRWLRDPEIRKMIRRFHRYTKKLKQRKLKENKQ